jgi:ribose-phosphate pyrophosphokinase
VVVVATHGLFAGSAVECLRSLPPVQVVVTDTVPQRTGFPFPCQVVSVAPLLAEAVRRNRAGESLTEFE